MRADPIDPEAVVAAATDIAGSPPVEDIDAVNDPRWPAWMVGSSSGLFTDQRWYRVLEETYELRLRARFCTDGASTAVLPYCVVDDPRGRRIVSLPFCDFVDAPTPAEAWAPLADPLLEAGVPVILDTTAGHPAEHDERLISTHDGVHHLIPVRSSARDQFGEFATLTKRQIRRAEREGIRFEPSTDPDHLRAFHELHVGVRKYRHGLLAQPLALFEAIDRHFFRSGDGVLIAGFVGQELVGGCLLLRAAEAWHYKFSVSHPDHRADGVSHAAVFHALQHTYDTGVPAFDFGRSNLAHQGLVDFKRRFRPVESELVRHQSSALPPTTFGDTLGSLTELFTRSDVPDSVTADAGAALYRYFA